MPKSRAKRRGAKVCHRKVKGQEQKLNPRKIQDEELRKRYDPTKTLKQNLASTDVKEMYYKRLPKSIPKEAKHAPKVGEEEVPICEQFIKKHGDDYAAMHWDIKMNVFQWTTAQCKKRVLAYQKGKVRSMSAEILSGHGVDLRKPLFGKAKERNVFGH
mmetsp:Transcript_41726/g.84240  ORF Transcript_41726/g.84240 Transcript_41726/m.84240 type:complete len:158 (-) Transcript_41726:218-691(-)|eukprot:CAMPEP_0113821696 /NCGR_PEP_ID=MMETSP0328-20130328/1869_1 /TAXON_ID=39455 /ORGANISM="Alexandrium minutum" /LENGTH=157 /DNA_ID=CAMNT_0000789631 /DNA_START=21 /DNA_END=494 /DNA_ORIENTATION=- /assembly_acc=CAM_ASM_000350